MTNINTIQVLFDNQQYDECLSAIKASEPNDDLDRLKAYCLQRTRKHTEAMEVWTSLIARHPDAPEFYAERGVCKLHLGFKSTLEDFNQAVELDSENPYRYACRAYARDRAGMTQLAVEDYRKALELEPDNEVTLNNLGLLEEKLGYAGLAQDRFKQADLLLKMSEELSIDSTEEQGSEISQEKPGSSIGEELKTMMSSPREFIRFIKDAGKLILGRKI